MHEAKWQPVETAPKDRAFLAWGTWYGSHGYTADEDLMFFAKWMLTGFYPAQPLPRYYTGCNVTHWMPLPDPPEE